MASPDEATPRDEKIEVQSEAGRDDADGGNKAAAAEPDRPIPTSGGEDEDKKSEQDGAPQVAFQTQLMQQIREMQERLAELEKRTSASVSHQSTQSPENANSHSQEVTITDDGGEEGEEGDGVLTVRNQNAGEEAGEEAESDEEPKLKDLERKRSLIETQYRKQMEQLLETKISLLERRMRRRGTPLPVDPESTHSNEAEEAPISPTRLQVRDKREESVDETVEEAESTTTSIPEDPGPPVTRGKDLDYGGYVFSQPEDAASSIARAEWPEFRAMSEAREGASCAIDVLIGEPGIVLKSRFPAKHRRGHRHSQPTQQLVTPLPERIRIHSRHLIRILDTICRAKIPIWRGNPLVLLRPFRLLVHHEKQLRAWYKTLEQKLSPASAQGDYLQVESQSTEENDDVEEPQPSGDDISTVAMEHLRCLLGFIDTDIAKRVDYLRNDPDCTKATFSDIWYLFRPGDEVIHKSGELAFRVVKVTGPTDHATPWFGKWQINEDGEAPDTSYTITCVALDFDGKFFGPVTLNIDIDRFEGERSITSLEIFPIRFYGRSATPTLGESGELWICRRNELIERGRKFAQAAAGKHMYYAGLTLGSNEEVESQVVIDFDEAFNGNIDKSFRPSLEQLISGEVGPVRPSETTQRCVHACCVGEQVMDDSYVEHELTNEYIGSLIPNETDRLPSVVVYRRHLKEAHTPGNLLTDSELVIAGKRVFGFILRSRAWAALDLNYLSEIDEAHKARGEFQGSRGQLPRAAFDRLVLPDEHKRLIQSLVAQHFRDKENWTAKDEQLDIVRGKGKGLIVLLHGAPGVGKTSTAEAVAERFEKPLFQITCGDLGSTAKEVEEALGKNFALANKWGCILLLDEADVFLAARKREDFTRNGLVAVFLRVLEYYAGVLFLTTNRIGDFDEAFTSRIHMSLYYPPLDQYSTKKVLELNLELISERFRRKGRRVIVEESQIFSHVKEYYEKHEHARWNGRQIRNSCQTALALAEYDSQGSEQQAPQAEINLRQGHFKIVSDAYLDFIQYLKTVRNTSADEWAKQTGIRALEKDLAALKAELAGEGGFKSKLGGMKARAAAAVVRDSEFSSISVQQQHPSQQQQHPNQQQQWLQAQGPANSFAFQSQPQWSAPVQGLPQAGHSFPPQNQFQPSGPGQPQVSYLNPNVAAGAMAGVPMGTQFAQAPAPVAPFQGYQQSAPGWPSPQQMAVNTYPQVSSGPHEAPTTQQHLPPQGQQGQQQTPGGVGGSQQAGQ